jgi:homoserine kinase
MFIDALYNKDEDLLKLALKDKLHQPYREKLVPGLADIMDNLKHINGVIGTVLCGAGPAILVIYNGIGGSEIKEKVAETWNYFNVNVNFLNLPIEKVGAEIL